MRWWQKADLWVMSVFINILALAVPIYVVQALTRYLSTGVDATLYALTFGVLLSVFLEYLFRSCLLYTSDAAGSPTTILVNSWDLNFSGNASGGVLGDVCLFDAGFFAGGQSGNIIFAIDADGNGTADNDIYFDVSDDISKMTYDVATEAFLFYT